MANNDKNDIVENVKGSAKEIAGDLTGDEDMEKEGRAQQEKVREAQEADAKAAEAEKLRKQSEGHKGEQKSRED